MGLMGVGFLSPLHEVFSLPCTVGKVPAVLQTLTLGIRDSDTQTKTKLSTLEQGKWISHTKGRKTPGIHWTLLRLLWKFLILGNFVSQRTHV